MKKPIALTLGEPAGIGPDILIQLAQQQMLSDVFIITDKYFLQQRADLLGLKLKLKPEQICHIKMPQADCCGKPALANATYVLNTLDVAIEGCLDNSFSALVTGPIQKSTLNEAGIKFSGHTEYLATKSNIDKTVMCFENSDMRVALVTTHLPLKDVSEAITEKLLIETVEIAHDELIKKFNLTKPVIGLCGLNPHAGEAGHLGREEIEVIQPALALLAKKNILCEGPYAADTIFQRGKFDCILSMYHDQLLPVIKYKNFHETVNITLGLPFVRTSVDHGTALNLAGTGKASPKNLLSAINTARRLSAS